MRNARLAAALAATFACVAVYAGPFDAFKGKVKPGLYEYKTEMDMGAIPGMPPGMGKQSHTFQHCVTQADVDKGENMGNTDRGGKPMPSNCEIKNVKASGNTASYTMSCPAPHEMNAEAQMTFLPNGYNMDMKMNMVSSKGGQPMSMTQHMEARLVGPCTGGK
jgi:hypothetical protein